MDDGQTLALKLGEEMGRSVATRSIKNGRSIWMDAPEDWATLEEGGLVRDSESWHVAEKRARATFAVCMNYRDANLRITW